MDAPQGRFAESKACLASIAETVTAISGVLGMIEDGHFVENDALVNLLKERKEQLLKSFGGSMDIVIRDVQNASSR